MNKMSKRLLRTVVPMLLLLTFAEVALADDPVFPPSSCKIDRAKLEAAVERYRRGEDPSVFLYKSYFMFCNSTRPLLKKYIALAHLRSAWAKPGTELDIEITVEHRRKRAAARVVKKPFFDPARKKA